MDLLILNHFGDVEFGGYQHNTLDLQNALVVNMMSHAHIASKSVQALTQSKGRIVAVSSAVGKLFIRVFTALYFVLRRSQNSALVFGEIRTKGLMATRSTKDPDGSCGRLLQYNNS